MGRIYLNESNQFVIWSNQTDSEKLALDNPQNLSGAALLRAIDNFQVPVLLSGWIRDEVIADMQESGFLPSWSEVKKEEEKPTPEFIEADVNRGKTGRWWIHTPTNTARYIQYLTMEQSSYEWSDDRFKGRVGGSKEYKWRSWSEDELRQDFERYPEKWRPFEIRYNPNLRENQVILL